MKKQILLIFTVCIGFAGCKKEKELQSDNNEKSEVSVLSSSQFQYYQYGTDITEADLIANPDDPLDEAYNKVELALSMSLLKIYEEHPIILNDMVTKAKNTRNKSYNLFVYATENPNVNAIFNTVFASRFSDFANYNNNWKNYVEAKYQYDIPYIPFVMFANQGEIDYNQPPYVAAPFEINEDKFPNFNDNIPMWVKSTTSTNMTSLNFEIAKIITNPIVIINNGILGDESIVYTRSPGLGELLPPSTGSSTISCTVPSHTHEKLKHVKTQINYRYDRSNTSEYVFVWGTTVGYNPLTFYWTNKYDEIKSYAKRKDIHKSDIGKLLDFEFTIYDKDIYPNGGGSLPALCFDIPYASGPIINKTFAVGAYEFDWYASSKLNYTIKDASGEPVRSYGARKYNSEWYFLDPSTNISYPFAERNPLPNSIYYNFNKGHLQLLRTY